MTISIRLEPHIEKRLNTLAAHTGRTKSYYLRELIVSGLDDLEDAYRADKIMENVRKGKERVHTSDQIRKDLSAENYISDLLNALSDEVNHLYGYVKIAGDNFGEPAINSGPCGPFANSFLRIWNQKFAEKVNIVFIMVKNSDECWHILIRLPNRLLYDGGHGVHSEEKYSGKFDIVDMIEYDIELLEKRSYGLDRIYPRYCPSFSINVIEALIGKYLNLIEKIRD